MTPGARPVGRWLSGSAGMVLSLLTLEIGAPLVAAVNDALAGGLVLIAFIGVFLACLWVSIGRVGLVVFGVLLALPMLAAGAWSIAQGTARSELLLGAAATPLMILTGLTVLLHVLRGDRVGLDRLVGTVAVFLIFGYAWAGVYSTVEWVRPGSFRTAGELRLGDLTYFSMVTQTTLGYGDIRPDGGVAKALAPLQAAAGLFYMAVIVARYVGKLDLDASDDAGAAAAARDVEGPG